MEFYEIIAKVSSDKRLVPDYSKAEKGKNFRALSEAQILDVLEPALSQTGWYYTTEIQKSNLDIREAWGSKGKKLQFIATIELRIVFTNGSDSLFTESVGMGIDDCDKAMGKAYTYALKYGLIKLFRLRYGDDPDAEASEPLYNEKPREDSKEEKPKTVQKNNTDKEKAMSEKQRDYILGMMENKGITSKIIMGKFDGYDPQRDEFIPMKIARAIIKYLEEQDDLPF